MQSLITSYLLQNHECILPGIGVLQIIHTPASTDAANNRILPPSDEIIFKREDHSKSLELIKYIADKNHIEQTEAADMLNIFCKIWKQKINAGEMLTFETIGSIYISDGTITFEKENSFIFLKPIPVETVYKKAEDTVLPAKEEPVLTEEKLYKEEVVVERSYWGLWALILFAMVLVVLFFHFRDHTVSGYSAGNQNRLFADSAKATYHK